MSSCGRDLYRWKRWTKSKPEPSVTKTKDDVGDIDSWLKKVEQASDEAAAITFGIGRSKVKGYKSNGHMGAIATIDALKDHDEAYDEAQDLLNQWMAEKCYLDDEDDDYDILDDSGDTLDRDHSSKTDIQGHWDRLLDENDPRLLHFYNGPSSNAVYQEIESRDDDRTVQQILDDLLDKDMGEGAVKKDLGLKKKKDPLVNMAARQQKVKENREKKERERNEKLKERHSQRDAKLKARQMVQQEERARSLKAQQEETKIQQEMTQIRKQLQESKHKDEEQRKMKKMLEEEAQLEIKREDAHKKEEQARQRVEDERRLEAQRMELMKKAAELKAIEETESIKCKHRHFQAWYQLVLDRRLTMGKVRALSDWRCLLRSWNAWRAYHRACQAERESREVERCVKDAHRKNLTATNHHRRNLLHKYFLTWRLWLRSHEEASKIEGDRLSTRNKMDSFLEAAASGHLWTDRSNVSDERVLDHKSRKKDLSTDLTHRSASPRVPSSDISHGPRNYIHSKPPLRSNDPSKPSKPRHAWQVTRKHLKLTVDEIANLGDGHDGALNWNQNHHDDSLHLDLTPRSVDESVTSVDSKRRTVNYKVNNFEHRYANQQKMLLDQRTQLDEQKRLIEDLQSVQREQLLKVRLKHIQDGGYATGVGNGTDVRRTHGSKSGIVNDASVPTTDRTQSDISVATATSSIITTDRTASSAASSGRKSTARSVFLKGMEERAALRTQRKAEREEICRAKEGEKLARLRAEEERKVTEEEEKKNAEIEQRREKKRLEKKKEVEKQQRLQKIADLNSRADVHFRHSVMKNYGFKPWRKLMETNQENWQAAVTFHGNLLLRTCLLPWHLLTQEAKQEKHAIADKMYRDMLLQRSMNSWKKYGHYLSIQYQRARRHYSTQTKLRLFKEWQEFTTNEKIRGWRSEELSVEYSERRILKRVFVAWRRYPKMLKQEKDREQRRQEMRKKVSSLLPDFGIS